MNSQMLMPLWGIKFSWKIHHLPMIFFSKVTS